MANNNWGQLTWSTGFWGQQSDINVSLTGLQSLSTSLNSVTISAEINSGWGRLTWGENEWGVTDAISVSVTGQSLITSLNSVTAIGTAVVDLTGQSLTASLNSVTVAIGQNVVVTGQSLIGSLNSVSVIGNATISGTTITVTYVVSDALLTMGKSGKKAITLVDTNLFDKTATNTILRKEVLGFDQLLDMYLYHVENGYEEEKELKEAIKQAFVDAYVYGMTNMDISADEYYENKFNNNL